MIAKRPKFTRAFVQAPKAAPSAGRTAPDIYGIFNHAGAGICICDELDRIVYINDLFRHRILPLYDGEATDFAGALVTNILAGKGLKLSSIDPLSFADTVRERRRRQSGNVSFTSDAIDGTWWLVTDSKLDNGWIVAVIQDVTAIKHTELQLRDAHSSALEDAETDFLTRAPNRRAGLCRAQDMLAASRITGGLFTIALLDIDHFKSINDVYGHTIGDMALVHLADVVMRGIGKRDHFSRIGGEEFLFVSMDLDVAELEDLLTRTLQPMPPFSLGGGASLRMTVSAGVAAALPDESWHDLMHRADLALYEAKAKGRNRIEQALVQRADDAASSRPRRRRDLPVP